MGVLLDRRARLAAGAAVRRHVPRNVHGQWAAPPDRADPTEILLEQARTRIAELIPTRYARMRLSAFAFYRGAAGDGGRSRRMPHTGLSVQLCGDAHMANFGSFPSPEGRPLFDVNDFDETLPGPFEWDVKRLAASLVLAGGDAGLDHAACRGLAARLPAATRPMMQGRYGRIINIASVSGLTGNPGQSNYWPRGGRDRSDPHRGPRTGGPQGDSQCRLPALSKLR